MISAWWIGIGIALSLGVIGGVTCVSLWKDAWQMKCVLQRYRGSLWTWMGPSPTAVWISCLVCASLLEKAGIPNPHTTRICRGISAQADWAVTGRNGSAVSTAKRDRPVNWGDGPWQAGGQHRSRCWHPEGGE